MSRTIQKAPKNHSTKSRYKELANELRQKIKRGALQTGEKLPTYTELYSSDGVATYTIDRAYSLLEQEGLIERRARSGVYVAHPNVQRAKDIIGLVFTALPEYRKHPYFIELLSGIQQTLGDENVQVLLIGKQNEKVMWEKVGGVILYEIDTDKLWQCFSTLPPGMPVVSLLERCDRGSLSSVLADDYNGTRQATEYLLQQNHRRIAYLSSLTVPAAKRRFAGYNDTMREANITPKPEWQHKVTFAGESHDFLEAGRASMQHWLQNGWKELGCTALLCQNDEVAAGAMRALQEAGLQVPRDVSVFGFDDQRISQLISPSLSTVHVPLYQIGARAAKMLLEQMHSDKDDHQREIQSVTLPTTLKIRETIRKNAT
jgi:DNA-binding LacI/PurR family transcriptional regulator